MASIYVMNTATTVTICTSELEKCWVGFDEICYGHYNHEGHLKIMLFNFL